MCSLVYDQNIQWKQQATLTVSPKPLSGERSDQSDENLKYIIPSTIVFVVVVAMVISVCSVVLVRWRKGRSVSHLLSDPDRGSYRWSGRVCLRSYKTLVSRLTLKGPQQTYPSWCLHKLIGNLNGEFNTRCYTVRLAIVRGFCFFNPLPTIRNS